MWFETASATERNWKVYADNLRSIRLHKARKCDKYARELPKYSVGTKVLVRNFTRKPLERKFLGGYEIVKHKISEIQQLPHPTQHMNTCDVIQIDAPDFDPDINGGLPTKEHEETQGSDSFIQHLSRESDECKAPALPQRVAEEVDWPDAIPVEIPPQPDQDNEQNIPVLPIRCETNLSEIPQLESDIDEEEEGQFEDLQTYLTHHNTYQESQNIRKEYRKRLLDLDDERYYWDIDCTYETYGPTRDHIPSNQTPGPRRTMQELIQTFSRGRGQVCREELHGHRPFGAHTRSLQSRIQRKIKKNQRM